MLIIDTREKGLQLANYLSSVGELNSRFDTLTAGDFFIVANKPEYNVVIERSTITDFLGKVRSGRLWEQLDKLKATSDNVHFLLEEPYKLKYTKWNTFAAVSLMAAVGEQCKLFISQNVTWSSSYIMALHRKYASDREVDKNEYNKRFKPRKDMTPIETAIWMLESVEGIGSATANKILSNYSIGELAKMEFEDISKALGNATLADRIYQSLKAKGLNSV